jgi:catechol 2,3-dioxygenase-like lactoylglutathione lyase family enzyme
MPTFHHVNLGVPTDGADTEAAFLIDILGYRAVEMSDSIRQMGARWFEADDGSQIHLSIDPDHRPAARAHVAVEYGPELTDVEHRLDQGAIPFQASDRPGFPRVVNCCDPAGNRWELRGDTVTA